MNDLGKRVEFHAHSIFSDGKLLPAALVREAEIRDQSSKTQQNGGAGGSFAQQRRPQVSAAEGRPLELSNESLDLSARHSAGLPPVAPRSCAETV